jgi:hypothetical protein
LRCWHRWIDKVSYENGVESAPEAVIQERPQLTEGQRGEAFPEHLYKDKRLVLHHGVLEFRLELIDEAHVFY